MSRTAIIGSGTEVDHIPILVYEYNFKTHALVLLLQDKTKRVIDTTRDKVVISDRGVQVDIFNGGKGV